MLSWISLTITLFFKGATGFGTNTTSWESKLLRDINSSPYNHLVRPVGQNHATEVNLKFSLTGIEDVSEQDNTFAATFVMVESWRDFRLQYNSGDYGNVRFITLPSSFVWKPDIVPWNVGQTNSFTVLYDDQVNLFSDGTVYYVPLVTIRAKCDLDVSDFPEDIQTCVMRLGSWAYSEKEMTLSLGPNETKEMVIKRTEDDAQHPVFDHPEWELIDNQAQVQVTLVTFNFGRWHVVHITMKLRRKLSLYRTLSVSPAAFLGLLIPFIFLLPQSLCERTGFGLLIILGFTLLIGLLEKIVPLSHSTTPRIGQFYIFGIIMSVLGTIVSICLHHLKVYWTRSPSPFITSLFLRDGWVRSALMLGEYAPNTNPTAPGLRPFVKSETENSPDIKQENLLNDVCKHLRYISGIIEASDIRKSMETEWEECIKAFDRISFLVFLIIYLMTAFVLLA